MAKRQEYWFRFTWIGSATPIHPMGIVTLLGGVSAGFGIFFGSKWLLDHGLSEEAKFGFALFAFWIVFMIIFIGSKTEPRR